MFQKLNAQFKMFREFYREAIQKKTYTPVYTIDEIAQDEEGQYVVSIRILNKRSVFQIQPEELLANDTLVDQFSPRDIRTLTYLGYLDVNAPKYKILAKRLSTEHDKIVFALKKKGEKEMIIKTAEQILGEQEILSSLKPEDANVVGYTVATESIHNERKQREALLQNRKKKIEDSKQST